MSKFYEKTIFQTCHLIYITVDALFHFRKGRQDRPVPLMKMKSLFDGGEIRSEQ